MAQEKQSFPSIPSANWFQLRDKFKQKLPSEVSASYIASAMGMNERSAGANVLPALKLLGIVTEEGRLTELAYDWRDDDKYSDVCQRIISDVYPESLTDIFHDATNIDQNALKAWFMRVSRVGEAAAMKYSRTYTMLLRGEVESSKDVLSTNKVQKVVKVKIAQKKEQKLKLDLESQIHEKPNPQATTKFSPNLHIDIQIHISPESSSEQIDKIFESMAKHLKGV